MKRRTILKGSLATGVLAVAAGAGLLKPDRVLAAPYPQAAFKADISTEEALKNALGVSDVSDSGDIKIAAPLQAENGAVVPIKVETSLPAEAIAIVAVKNPSPMTTFVNLSGAGGFYSARIKMGQTSDVHAVVKSGGKLFKATQQIKVTVGGCGG